VAFMLAVVVYGLLAGGPAQPVASGGTGPCATATSNAVLTSEGEPGEPLVVSGTVFAPDGVTPAPCVLLYVYQTDATGVYNTQRNAPPRIRGWLRTDAQGRFRFTTIVPGAYPSGRQAAHIHTQLWGGGHEWQWNNDILFEGDPNVGERERQRSAGLGRFAFIKPPRGAITFDLRLKPRGDRMEQNIAHGARECGLG
jgi:protocatechuate 3,4-dioxygenase beta subunit